MKTKYFTLTALLLVQCVFAYCQRPPQEFIDGLQLFKTNKSQARKELLIAIQKAPDYYGSYHFLGIIYAGEHKPDSAIWCFKKSIALNTANINHTREMVYVRLINAYTNQDDFQDAFTIAWDSFKQYPDNTNIATSLKNLCLWAFYIKHDHLSPSYLSTDVKDEYVANSIPIEYLILRNLRLNDDPLKWTTQALVNKKGGSYDVFTCVDPKTNTNFEISFKINWDMNKDFGGKVPSTKDVIDNAKNPVYERVGAMLVADNKTDVKLAIEKMMN
jgi:tetratricopeptide (TPR) repeat protein